MYAKIPKASIYKMSIVQTYGKKTLAQVKSEQGCQYVINLTLFSWSTYKPLCPTRINGITMATSSDTYWSYAFNKGNDIQMISSKYMSRYDNVFSCVTLLKDGKPEPLYYNKDLGGSRGRTAVGIDNGGNLVLFCSKDGSVDAMTPERLRTYMKDKLNCISAIMMDSGGSSQCDLNGKTITSSRKVANYLCVWTKPVTSSAAKESCPYAEPTSTIRYGSTGSAAKWVQWYLKKLVSPSIEVDGVFGQISVNTLKEFQKSAGITVDGLCGSGTRAKLKEKYAG